MFNSTHMLKFPGILAFFFLLFQQGYAQTTVPQILSIKDFAVWGGNAAPSTFNPNQGVFINGGSIIKGNVGSTQQINFGGKLWLRGYMVSGNKISMDRNPYINGDLIALNGMGDRVNPAIVSKESGTYKGNLMANGKINLKFDSWVRTVTLSGQVFVPAPTANNYQGPTPAKGFFPSFLFPTLPALPSNTAYDSKGGTTVVNTTRILTPGSYGALSLTGGQTITFNGPGNYIFTEVNNTGKNNLVFDLKKIRNGTINLYIIGNAKFGTISVKGLNEIATSKIYTEVHGNGATNNGNAFEILADPAFVAGTSAWLGNVWASNGSIRVVGLKTSTVPVITGALWSAVAVRMADNISLTYKAPSSANLTFIDPYYAPPEDGKVVEAANVIGAELTSLSTNPDPIVSTPLNEIFQFDGQGNVMIEVISKAPNDNVLKQQLANMGMTDTIDNGPHSYIITGNFPIALLSQLNTNPLIEYVRPLYPPVSNRGQVTTQGDKTMRTDLVRERFGLDGSGVKIGVLSDSYNNQARAQDDIDQGDLPGVKSSGDLNDNPVPVQVLQDLRQGGKDEGRAMLQIIHDIAPKASLAFRTGFLTAGDFAKGILELADPNLGGGRCDIIVDDLSYITEPFFRDGVVAQVVDQVVNQGVTYFTSAGNFGKRSYEATFRGVTNTNIVPSPAQIHRFGNKSTDIYQSILLKPGTYTIVLQWDDEFHSLGDGGVQTDLDLYLVGANGLTLFGFNRSNLFKDPFEVCPFVVKEETTARVMVVRANGTNNVRFKYIIFKGDATILDYTTGNSTIVGHANSKGAITVGAMFYENRPGVTANWPGVASFSSRGGTSVIDNNVFTVRNKPEIIGPNGVNTTVNMGGAPFDDGDSYPNFFGTSAAAPHAAAVGALLVQARKKFNLQTVVTPAEIRQQMINRAGKFSYLPGTFSFEGGFGYLLADSSLTPMANAIPSIDTITTVVPGSQNGVDSFQVRVKGKYFTSTTRLYKNGVPLPKISSPNATEIIALVPPIAPGEDPAFRLFNAAKSPSGEDGGFSEPYFFFSNKKTVIIKAANKARKYLQDNPPLTVDITVDGVPIDQTSLTRTALKLDDGNLVLKTIATPRSKAGQYGIFPELLTPLAPDDTLLAKYRFIFQSGTLNVGKLPLTITPQFKRLKYGEFPDNIVYDYQIETEPANPAADMSLHIPMEERLAEVQRIHRENMTENGIIVVKGFKDPRNTLTQDDLNNMATLASFQSIANARKYLVQNERLVPVTGIVPEEKIGDQRFILEVPLSTLLNYDADSSYALLNSTNTQTTGIDTATNGFLNLKVLTKGEASASVPNGQLKALVNGQLMGTVNGELETALKPNKYAIVDGNFIAADDIVFNNGQLRALVNGEWKVATNGQLRAIVNGAYAEFEMSVVNGQLRAIVNGYEMQFTNGQLRALVNGQNVSIANGQLRALVNGPLVPLVNNELMGVVNGQLKALVNGQVYATINGQLFAMADGMLEEATEVTLVNGQLRALVNGQLRALVNGQLKALVNGELTDIDINTMVMENGQLRALVNGQLRALVNGQLKALVNGQLKALVNSEQIAVGKVSQLANGQLRALVNGIDLPIKNGQLRALVNGQLRAMVNGELMAEVNGEITFTIFENGQLKALVNGVYEPLVNGQLKALVNGQLEPVDSYTITNGQLKALVNGEEWVFPNGQLKALVNGQLKALVNNFDVSGTNNNARTMVLVDRDDLLKQEGDIGGMFSMAMVTGLNADGNQKIIPAAFINENYEVTYQMGQLEIIQAPLFVTTRDTSKIYGEVNPPLYSLHDIRGLAYGELLDINPWGVTSVEATESSNVGLYPISFNVIPLENYSWVKSFGNLSITPRTLTVKADNKVVAKSPGAVVPPLTITYEGLAGDDNEDSVCLSYIVPSSPKVIDDYDRTATYTNVKINGGSNVFVATPGQSLTLSGNFVSVTNPYMMCPGCVTQIHVGMGDGSTNFFSNCYEATASGTSRSIATSFIAPATPGIYYITHKNTWWYYCGQFPLDNHKVANNQKFAIAVVIVTPSGTNSGDKITAGLATGFDIGTASLGDYPITLQGCGNYNPNYNVTLVNGTLTLEPDCNLTRRQWKADGNFNEESGLGNGTPYGSVTATGAPHSGSNSFLFDGTPAGIISGTGGSVTGTGDFSVSAWVKTTAIKPMVVVQQRDSEIDGEYILKIGGGHGTHVYNPDSGKVYFMMFDWYNNVFELTSKAVVNDGQWHLVKGERKGTTMSIYIDGTVDTTITTPGIVYLNGTIGTYIGVDQRDSDSHFEGLMDDVRVQICDAGTGGSIVGHHQDATPLAMVETGLKTRVTSDKVFPNPAAHTIRLELVNDVKSPGEILVMDGFGKSTQVRARKVDDGVYELNISGLRKGLYFIRAQFTGGLKTFKFVKM